MYLIFIMEIMSKRRAGASRNDDEDDHHNDEYDDDDGRLMLVTKKTDSQNTRFELELIVRLLKVGTSSSVRAFAVNHIRKLDKITFKALEKTSEFLSESASSSPSSWSTCFEKALRSRSGREAKFERWRTAVSDALKKVHDKKTASGHFYCMRIVSHFHLSTLAALGLVPKHPWANFLLWYRENINTLFKKDRDRMAAVFTEKNAIYTDKYQVEFQGYDGGKLYARLTFTQGTKLHRPYQYYFHIYGHEAQFVDDVTGKPKIRYLRSNDELERLKRGLEKFHRLSPHSNDDSSDRRKRIFLESSEDTDHPKWYFKPGKVYKNMVSKPPPAKLKVCKMVNGIPYLKLKPLGINHKPYYFFIFGHKIERDMDISGYTQTLHANAHEEWHRLSIVWQCLEKEAWHIALNHKKPIWRDTFGTHIDQESDDSGSQDDDQRITYGDSSDNNDEPMIHSENNSDSDSSAHEDHTEDTKKHIKKSKDSAAAAAAAAAADEEEEEEEDDDDDVVITKVTSVNDPVASENLISSSSSSSSDSDDDDDK